LPAKSAIAADGVHFMVPAPAAVVTAPDGVPSRARVDRRARRRKLCKVMTTLR
jgi:hypothetical protein